MTVVSLSFICGKYVCKFDECGFTHKYLVDSLIWVFSDDCCTNLAGWKQYFNYEFKY